MNLFSHRTQPVSDSQATAAPSAEATLLPTIDANIPLGDRRGIRKLISDALSSALSPFAGVTLVADPTPVPTSPPGSNQASETSAREPGALRRFFGYCWSKVLDAFSSARDFLLTLGSHGSRTGGAVKLDGPAEGQPTEKPTPCLSRASSAAHEGESRENSLLAGEGTLHPIDSSSSSVAEATRKEHERKKELMLASELRSKRKKSTAADTMRAIDAENGIVNPDLAIMIDNLMGCFGEETSAIRAIIEAQARERDPLKKKH